MKAVLVPSSIMRKFISSLAELSLHRAGKLALNYLAAEHRGHVKATTRRKLFAIC